MFVPLCLEIEYGNCRAYVGCILCDIEEHTNSYIAFNKQDIDHGHALKMYGQQQSPTDLGK